MLHRFARFLVLAVVGGMTVSSAYADNAPDKDFPLRWRYPDVKTLSTDAFFRMYKDAVVVDSRTRFEWETMRVNGAVNIPVDEVDTGLNHSFEDGLAKLAAPTQKPIIFYCNGRACPKSYEAARRAQRMKVANNVFAYDAGIFDWARAHPELTTLYTKTPIESADLISIDRFTRHLLPARDFSARVDGPNCDCLIVDIRDVDQRDSSLFPMREEHVSLDNKSALNAIIERAKRDHKTLLIYDAVGKQVQWLQYYLVRKGLTDYYFMKNGESGYFASLK